MLTPIVIIATAGYSLLSYGYLMVKGYDITFRSWMSPLHPYQWPAAGAAVPTVPQGKIFPTGKG